MTEGNGRVWSPEVKQLGDAIAALAAHQAAQLNDYLERAHGIKAVTGVEQDIWDDRSYWEHQLATRPPDPVAFTVVLDGVADPIKKIGVIRVVREITGLGLKEARDLVEGAPKPVKENLSKNEAEALMKKLEDGGAKVSLKPIF
jgi:large subunit ribosomal protein L7/L12